MHRKCKVQIALDKDNILKILGHKGEETENIEVKYGKSEHTYIDDENCN